MHPNPTVVFVFLPAASLVQLHQGVFPVVLEEVLEVSWVADPEVLQEGLQGVLHIQVVHHHLLVVHLLQVVLQVLAGHHLVVQGNHLGMLVVPLPYRADHCLLVGAFLFLDCSRGLHPEVHHLHLLLVHRLTVVWLEEYHLVVRTWYCTPNQHPYPFLDQTLMLGPTQGVIPVVSVHTVAPSHPVGELHKEIVPGVA